MLHRKRHAADWAWSAATHEHVALLQDIVEHLHWQRIQFLLTERQVLLVHVRRGVLIETIHVDRMVARHDHHRTPLRSSEKVLQARNARAVLLTLVPRSFPHTSQEAVVALCDLLRWCQVLVALVEREPTRLRPGLVPGANHRGFRFP